MATPKLKPILLSLLFFLTLPAAMAKKITVSQDGSGDFSTIQEALNSLTFSAKYQTIYIKNGFYAEKIFVDSHMHHIKFLGESTEGVVISHNQARDNWRCEHPDDFGAATFNVQGSDLIFENLSILNTYGFEAEGDVTIDCLNESGKASSADARKLLPREAGEVEGKKIVRKDGHQFAFRSMDGATRIKFYNCVFRSGGGDTVSPWDVAGGMFYFKNCIIEGHVDMYCPRGSSIIENSLFICHNKNAAIWHDGSEKESDKSVLINCRFEGEEGFKLGRYHREAQMYLINCSFSKEMADAPIYQSGDRALQWGHRIYYNNCTKEGKAYDWYKTNTDFTAKDFTFKKVFGEKW